jgi:hypothetical protein
MLVENHRQHLIEEGFSDRQIGQLMKWGVRTIGTAKEAHELKLSQKVTGIWFPFGQEFGQLRVDQPKPENPKYLSPFNVRAQVWTPPGERAEIITEGYKDAAAGTLMGGIATGAIGGVSQYQCLTKDSNQMIVFDADGWKNPTVFGCLIKAGMWTGGKIAIVSEEYGPKAGLLEYLKAGGKYESLLRRSQTPKQMLLAVPVRWIEMAANQRANWIDKTLSLTKIVDFTAAETNQFLRLISAVTQRSVESLKQQPIPKKRSTFKPLSKVASHSLIPLELVISRDHQQLLKAGTASQRRLEAFALAMDLIGAARALEEIGQSCNDRPREMLQEFAQRCEPALRDREVEGIYRSAERRNPVSSVPVEKIVERIEWYQKQVA